MDDTEIVSRQLGRSLTCAMTVKSRCGGGFPLVIKNAAAAKDGSPFPTLYWLTCPVLRTDISRLEASGALADFSHLIQSDDPARAALLASDRAYRRERARGLRPPPTDDQDVGIGGSRDPLHLKCLHAHAADYLAQGLNPVGKRVLKLAPLPDNCDLCADLCE